MNKVLSIVLLFIVAVSTANAQYAVVVDEGGFVNVYDSEKEELDRLGSDAVVFVEEEDEEWALVDYTKYGDYAGSSGFVKKEKLIDITSFTELKVKEDSATFVVLGNDSLSIRIDIKPFEQNANEIVYFSEDSTQISTINEEEYWGTKIDFPSNQYQSIVLKNNDETIEFPEHAYFNLFNPHCSLTKAFYDQEADVLYIYATNGDHSGPYTVLWVVESGEYSVHYIFD